MAFEGAVEIGFNKQFATKILKKKIINSII